MCNFPIKPTIRLLCHAILKTDKPLIYMDLSASSSFLLFSLGAPLSALLIINSIAVIGVAPHVGAWIEISHNCNYMELYTVAPHVGAWIEISGNINSI